MKFKIGIFVILDTLLLFILNNFYIYGLPYRLQKNFFCFYFQKNRIYLEILAIFQSGDYIRMFFLLSIIMGFIIFYKKTEVTYHGSAKFATTDDITKLNIISNNDDGVVLGMTEQNKIMTHTGSEHIIAIAPTRSGKGVNTVLTTLFTWQSSVIVNDIKGECWDLTSGFRRTILKQKCIFFNPMDETGESINYNPLDLVKVGTSSEQEEARNVASILLDDGSAKDRHWVEAAINLLTAVILHVKYVKYNASFIDIMEFLEDPKEPLIDKIGNVIAKKLNEYGDIIDNEEIQVFDHYNSLQRQMKVNKSFKEIYLKDTNLHPVVGATFITFFSTPDKERDSIKSTCVTKLGIFKDPRVIKNISKSDISPKEIMNNKVSLYLITPPKAIDMTRPLFRLIITQTIFDLTDKMEFNNRRKIEKEKKMKITFNFKNFFFEKKKKDNKNKKILFLIDEFPALGKLDLLEKALAYVAGYGLKFLIIAQSVNQLNKIYGKENSILDNCHVQIYFTPNDPETPKVISSMMGNKTEKTISKSRTGFLGKETISENYIARPLMTPGEVRTFPYEKILVIVTGNNPIKGNKIFWFKHKKYKENANYNIPYPSYLDLLSELESNGTTEYALDYLIYLKKGYKTLKIIVDEFNISEFVSKILNNEKLEAKIKDYINLNEKTKNKLKKDYLKNNLDKKIFKNNEEYKKNFNEYLENFSDKDYILLLKKQFFSNNKVLEKTLETNLNSLEKLLNEKEKIKLEIIEFLQMKKIPDIYIPTFSEKELNMIIEEKIDIETIKNQYSKYLNEDDNSYNLDIPDFSHILQEILMKNIEIDTEEIEEF